MRSVRAAAFLVLVGCGDTTPRSTMPTSEATLAADRSFNWILGKSTRFGRIAGHTGSTGDYSASIIMALDRRIAALALVAAGGCRPARGRRSAHGAR